MAMAITMMMTITMTKNEDVEYLVEPKGLPDLVPACLAVEEGSSVPQQVHHHLQARLSQQRDHQLDL